MTEANRPSSKGDAPVRNVEQCYLIVLSTNESRAEAAAAILPLQPEVDAYLQDLERQGSLFGAGQLLGDGWRDPAERGLIAVRAQSSEVAQSVADAHPLVSGGVYEAVLIPWWRNGGSSRIEVRFANREVDIDGQTFALDPAGPTGSGVGVSPHETLFPCLMRTNPNAPSNPPPVEDLKKGHQVFLREHEHSGHLAASGPLRDDDGPAKDVGTGLIVLRAADLEHAQQIIDEEPYVKAGVRTATVAVWERTFGSSALEALVAAASFRSDTRQFGLLPKN